MNHKAIILHEAAQRYRERSFILHKLDDRHFEALNSDDHVEGLNGYCLDALDESPAGSVTSSLMNGIGARHATYTHRGLSLQDLREREALVEQLIAEILAEEKVPK